MYKIFGTVYIILVLIICIFLNLGDKQTGPVSAYSVFNKGKKHLLGDLRMAQIEKELLSANKDLKDYSDEDLLTISDLANKNKKMVSSKMRNKRCPCGSNKKYKNCCGNPNPNSSDY